MRTTSRLNSSLSLWNPLICFVLSPSIYTNKQSIFSFSGELVLKHTQHLLAEIGASGYNKVNLFSPLEVYCLPAPLELHLSSDLADWPTNKAQQPASWQSQEMFWGKFEIIWTKAWIQLMLCTRSLKSFVYITADVVLLNENPSLKEFINWFFPDNTRISGMQISFLSLTGLSKPSTSSSRFSSPQNKITTLRNILEEHMGKNKFPCTQMLCTKYIPSPNQHYSLQNVFNWKEREEQLAVVSI